MTLSPKLTGIASRNVHIDIYIFSFPYPFINICHSFYSHSFYYLVSGFMLKYFYSTYAIREKDYHYIGKFILYNSRVSSMLDLIIWCFCFFEGADLEFKQKMQR